MEDFNGTINNGLDRSTEKTKNKEKGKLPASFFKLMENEELIDV